MLRSNREAIRLGRQWLRLTEQCRADQRQEPSPWGFEWGQHYLPKYFASEPADFHGPLFKQLADLHTKRDTKSAIIAPREGAKSTVVTLAYVLRCAVERLEPYILILSDSGDQATEKLSDIRRELDSNAILAADYPDSCGAGPSWRSDRIELPNGVVIQAIGRRGRIRGRRNREVRPSLVIFDDVENNASITSAAERTATWRWATREVIPAGSAGTNFLSVGSALHPQCVAVRLGQLAGWTSHRHQAVHRWPDRMDLWDQWERKATNLADDNRAQTAAAFYAANRAEMDRGADVYWPARWPLYDLMKRRAEIGATAFNTEYQGIPSTEGITEWPAELFDFPGMWFDDWPTDMVYRVQSLDPSKGADSNSGDFQAHVLVGYAQDYKMYVEAVLTREPIPEMVERSLTLSRRTGFGPLTALAVEENDSLGLLISEFREQIEKRHLVVPLKGIHNSINKIVRCRRLGIYFSRKQVRFRNTPGTRLLVDQLREFPQADHDDGPDALELAVRTMELITNPQ
jgi:predicted phage terminase large subunit-like protein